MELKFLKELLLIKKIALKKWDIFHNWFLLDHGYKFQPMSVVGVMIYWWCLWTIVMLLFQTLREAIVYYWLFIISGISKTEAIDLIKNINFEQKKWNIIKHKNLLPHINMGKEVLKFHEIEIEKRKFYCHKNASL